MRSDLDSISVGLVSYDGADMTRPDEIEAMVQGVNSRHGGVDILVNNAGIQLVSPIDEFPRDRWDQIIDINMNSTFHTVRAALPGMKAQVGGA